MSADRLTTEKLSEKEYWDSVLRDAQLPRVNSAAVYNYRVTMEFVEPILRTMAASTFLEVGCGSSGWLPYFAREYGYRVSGIDYSEIGCRLAEQNLRMLHIDYDEIICQDIFAWQTNKQFDIIFSYGVIEHFVHPEEVLRICCERLALGGIIITLVPNSQGLVGLLSRIFTNEVYGMHKVISRKSLQEMHENLGLENVKTEYAGNFSVAVIPWVKSKSWLFKEKSPQRNIALHFIWYADRILSLIWKWTRWEYRSHFFSPYVITIARKNR